MTTYFISPSMRAPHKMNPSCSELEFSLYKEEEECSMNRILELQNSFESAKKIMLMHEVTFKHQVRELHRLYNLQKKLMHEQEKEIIAQMKSTTNSEFAVLWHHSETDFSSRDNRREQISGGCSGESSRIPFNFDLERPRPGETTTSSNFNMVEEHKDLRRIDEETDVEVELTLSIGHCPRKGLGKERLVSLPHTITQF